jgi:N-acetylmuramoyl-L-alanine amidase
MMYAGIVVDYGHGGMVGGVYQTAGKQYTFTDYGGYWIGEGVSNRKSAASLIRQALAAGVRVWDAVAAREWTEAPTWDQLEQKDVSLADRVAYANDGPRRRAVYLSLHSNAVGDSSVGPSQRARGVEMYTSPGQTAADPIATSLIEAFRAEVAEGIPVRRGDTADGDPDMEARFYVLTRTAGPAILGEVGFFVNIHDARFLDSCAGQEAIGRAYLAGVLPFVRG